VDEDYVIYTVTSLCVLFHKKIRTKEKVDKWATREKKIKANGKNRKKAAKPQKRSGNKKKRKKIANLSGYS